MLNEYFMDSVRFMHFSGFALGMGAGAFADWSVLRQLHRPFTDCDLGVITRVHYLVMVALVLLWLSGIALVYARTGFIMEMFSAKLIIKLVVVGVLTLNAALITAIAMPILRRRINAAYIQFPLEEKILLAAVACISMCSWLSALILGVFTPLKQTSFAVLIPIFSLIYSGGLFVALVVTVCLQISYERRFPVYRHSPGTQQAAQ